MSRNELIAKIEALNEWERLIAEAQAEAESIRDTIKAEMLERNTEELQAGRFIIRWTSVLSNRFDRTQYPSSHTNIFRAFLALLQKMNIALPLGSRPISSSTMQERVLKLFLASVKPGLT